MEEISWSFCLFFFFLTLPPCVSTELAPEPSSRGRLQRFAPRRIYCVFLKGRRRVTVAATAPLMETSETAVTGGGAGKSSYFDVVTPDSSGSPNHIISCMSKLLSPTIAIKACHTRRRPARPLRLIPKAFKHEYIYI